MTAGLDGVPVAATLQLRLGPEQFLLLPGEAAEFDTAQPHALDSADGESVELLILFGVQGERAHVRASKR